MGNHQSEVADSNQTVSNNIYQQSDDSCKATCENIESGTTVVISNVGNVDINSAQNCSHANASCVMQSQLDDQIQNIIESYVQQVVSAESAVYLNGSNAETSVNTNTQNVRNNVTQLLTSSCQADATNIQDGVLIAIDNVKDVNLDFAQNGQAQATCTINNLAKNSVFNMEQATTNQVEKYENTFAVVAISIVAFIIICGIFAFLFLGSGFTADTGDEGYIGGEGYEKEGYGGDGGYRDEGGYMEGGGYGGEGEIGEGGYR